MGFQLNIHKTFVNELPDDQVASHSDLQKPEVLGTDAQEVYTGTSYEPATSDKGESEAE